jgi:hypothetical protein
MIRTQIQLSEAQARALAAAGRFRSENGDLSRRHDELFADSVADWPSSSTPPR